MAPRLNTTKKAKQYFVNLRPKHMARYDGPSCRLPWNMGQHEPTYDGRSFWPVCHMSRHVSARVGSCHGTRICRPVIVAKQSSRDIEWDNIIYCYSFIRWLREVCRRVVCKRKTTRNSNKNADLFEVSKFVRKCFIRYSMSAVWPPWRPVISTVKERQPTLTADADDRRCRPSV